ADQTADKLFSGGAEGGLLGGDLFRQLRLLLFGGGEPLALGEVAQLGALCHQRWLGLLEPGPLLRVSLGTRGVLGRLRAPDQQDQSDDTGGEKAESTHGNLQ